MGVCKTHSFFLSCHSFYSWLFFLQVPVNNLFFSFFLNFFFCSPFFFRFDILMTGREVYYAMMLNVYIRSNTFLSVCLLALFHFSLYNWNWMPSHDTNRRSAVFSSSFFFLKQSSPFHYFSSLSLSLALCFSPSFFDDDSACVTKKEIEKFEVPMV